MIEHGIACVCAQLEQTVEMRSSKDAKVTGKPPGDTRSLLRIHTIEVTRISYQLKAGAAMG
jgi:hypothetical protein